MESNQRRCWGYFLFGLSIFLLILGTNVSPAHSSTFNTQDFFTSISVLGWYLWISLASLIAGSYLLSLKE